MRCVHADTLRIARAWSCLCGVLCPALRFAAAMAVARLVIQEKQIYLFPGSMF